METGKTLTNAVICDLDGTLAIHDGRGPYEFWKCGTDLLNKQVASVLVGRRVIIVSGRDDSCLNETIKWLSSNEVEYECIFMRRTGDTRNDAIVKEEIYNRWIKDFYEIDFVLDDRNRVVDKWRELGLQCFQVAPGDF